MPGLPIYNIVQHIEPRQGARDFDSGFAARVYDPAWFLARQWMLGEHQGENASTPVRVEVEVSRTPIGAPDDGLRLDPQVVPAEAIVEAEPDSWWTFGRRLRLGARVARQAAAAGMALPEVARFRSALSGEAADPRQPVLPAPYEHLSGAFDGLALWREREALGLGAFFGAEGPPGQPADRWQSADLEYRARFECEARPIVVPAHRGGHMDWYSVEGDETALLAAESGTLALQDVFPAPLQYPGAPHSRWWEIEDAAVDIGGYPPDASHFATMLLVDLVVSHSDDWFTFPINAYVGNVVGLRRLTVVDGFGERYSSEVHTDLKAPDDWSLFATSGMSANALVLWPTAAAPLEGRVLERVQFGLDEYSNRLWAVERVLGGREVPAASPSPPQGSGPASPAGLVYEYVASQDVAPGWHPYEVVDNPRRFMQRGLADLSRQPPQPMPAPQAVLLQPVGTQTINPKAVPANGLELERRWRLARDADGAAVLWIQRQRKPLLGPPARNLRFDVLRRSG